MGNSLHKDAEHRRQAALPILAIATAIAAVGALPGDDFDIFTHPDRVSTGAAKNVA